MAVCGGLTAAGVFAGAAVSGGVVGALATLVLAGGCGGRQAGTGTKLRLPVTVTWCGLRSFCPCSLRLTNCCAHCCTSPKDTAPEPSLSWA